MLTALLGKSFFTLTGLLLSVFSGPGKFWSHNIIWNLSFTQKCTYLPSINLKKVKVLSLIYKIYHLCTILIKQTNLQAFEQSVQQCASKGCHLKQTSKFRWVLYIFRCKFKLGLKYQVTVYYNNKWCLKYVLWATPAIQYFSFTTFIFRYIENGPKLVIF